METIEINIPVSKNVMLQGNLSVPAEAESLVIFSHGSGSSRFSSRNNFVANILNKEKIATLLTDLLTQVEDNFYENRFDIELLTVRLMAVTEHVRKFFELKNKSIGYFGASTGAASALKAAAQLNDLIQAVVSRGGRPDLANESFLQRVKSPALLIVGSLDKEVILLNEQAYLSLNCDKKMEIVEGATHLFEEPGKLNEVAALATGWFKKYLLTPHAHAVQR